MGELKKRMVPVKLFCGMVSADEELFQMARKAMERRFGPSDSVSGILPFDKTAYYEPEMGPGLKRYFVSFRNLVTRESISGTKIWTNRLEWKLSPHKDRRSVNLDPGFVTQANVCLATTKDFQHRIYVGKNIYLENTLRLRKGRWEDWEWTYPDYRTDEYKAWFGTILGIYKVQLKAMNLLGA